LRGDYLLALVMDDTLDFFLIGEILFNYSSFLSNLIKDKFYFPG